MLLKNIDKKTPGSTSVFFMLKKCITLKKV
jgi:hypothetical protein